MTNRIEGKKDLNHHHFLWIGNRIMNCKTTLLNSVDRLHSWKGNVRLNDQLISFFINLTNNYLSSTKIVLSIFVSIVGNTVFIFILIVFFVFIIWWSDSLQFLAHNCRLSEDTRWKFCDVLLREGWAGWTRHKIQSMETVNEWDSSLFCDFRFDVPSDGCGSQHAKVLTFLFAALVGLNGGN